ncbi:MAG: transcriptional regulator [Desulfobacteraceae bacterium]|nr:transcriptional regulator [Desulfobacteraceae bacterium]
MALKKKNISQAGIARELDYCPQHIFSTIKDPKRSWPVACHIAKALNKKVEEIWPENFHPNQPPPKPGRPLSKGFYNHQTA